MGACVEVVTTGGDGDPSVLATVVVSSVAGTELGASPLLPPSRVSSRPRAIEKTIQPTRIAPRPRYCFWLVLMLVFLSRSELPEVAV